jgi:arylsulfatase A-like enzyme
MSARLALVLALCAFAAACGGGEDSGADTQPAPAQVAAPIARNLIVISLDTLRSDRLGAYGHGRATSPSFDALAARGALFTRAVSESPWTLPAHATLFTGLHPLRHGVLQKDHKLGAPLLLLPEILAQAGFATFAFTGGGFVLPTRGFDQGFESFKAHMGSRTARKEGIGRWIAPALSAIDGAGGRRFFGFLHGYATHCPYTPPEPFAGTFRDPAAEPLALAGLCQEDFAKLAPTPGQVRSVADGYDDCVRWMDEELGELVRQLERNGLLDDTLLVVLSDHGEELSEHGTIGHGHSLRPELLRVPLLFVGPGIAPARLDDEAALADVLPTVLELLGLEAPQGLDGRSLAARLRGAGAREDSGRLAYAEFAPSEARAPLEAWIEGDLQLVRDTQSGALELFSLAPGDDPTLDLAPQRAAQAQQLSLRLSERRAALGRSTAEQAGEIPAEELRALRELGYAGD